MADDMGYSDLGCTGSEIQTPNLTNSPRRVSCLPISTIPPVVVRLVPGLMTGLYQHQVGWVIWIRTWGFLATRRRMNRQCITLAQALHPVGYRSIMIGKWHLGHEPEHWPLGRGFDRMYGIPKGGGVYFYPCVVVTDRSTSTSSKSLLTPLVFDRCLYRLCNSVCKRNPLQMILPSSYIWPISPHIFPLQAWKEDIDKYRDPYQKGYASIRKVRLKSSNNSALSRRNWHSPL